MLFCMRSSAGKAATRRLQHAPRSKLCVQIPLRQPGRCTGRLRWVRLLVGALMQAVHVPAPAPARWSQARQRSSLLPAARRLCPAAELHWALHRRSMRLVLQAQLQVLAAARLRLGSQDRPPQRWCLHTPLHHPLAAAAAVAARRCCRLPSSPCCAACWPPSVLRECRRCSCTPPAWTGGGRS